MCSPIERELILSIRNDPDYDCDRIDYLNLGHKGQAIKILAKTDSLVEVYKYLHENAPHLTDYVKSMVAVWQEANVQEVNRDTWTTINKNSGI